MIFWIASYPKSGNTWVRALVSAYYYSQDGFFSEKIIKNIGQFPEKIHFQGFDYNKEIVTDTSRFWIRAQEKLNQDKKIKFKKTHNCLSAINGNNFTNKKNTIACIYIVRDPRNLITSLKNHYELDYNDALEFMTNEKKFIFDYNTQNDYSDFQFISSWELNYQSWKNNNLFPIKFLKYEDLLFETFFVFKEIVEFIDKITNNKKGFNKEKAKNAVQTTSFENLKKIEINRGFSESIISRVGEKKIPFFHLGPQNNWKKNFNNKFNEKLSTIFSKNLKELDY